MKSILAMLALAASSQALVRRESGCCFHIEAYGGPGGPVGQLSDGQNRIGDGSLSLGEYCIDSNGGLTDAHGRGCILTPPTTQWQCDIGATPTPDFSIGCNGTISYKDESTFFACPTGDHGGYNIYSEMIEGEPLCTPIWLLADQCHSGCPSPRPVSPPHGKPAPLPAPAKCPGELTGNWEFPHLIIPINSAEPNKAYGTQFNGTSNADISSIFNFDIPESYRGKECTLEFLFPTHDQLDTSSYEVTGSGEFEFAFLKGVATKETTFADSPEVIYNFGTFDLQPGTATVLGSCPHGCPAGETVSFQMNSAKGESSINYFQDSNPCPIGLYITAV